MKLTILELARLLGGSLIGDGSGEIDSVGPIKTAGSNSIIFITDNKYLAALKQSDASGVIASKPIEGLTKPQIVVANIDAALIESLNMFARPTKTRCTWTAPSAYIAPTAKISKNVYIGRNVTISDDVELGENSIIEDGCKIGENCKIGKGCRLDSNVVVYHNCNIGNNVIIQSNSTIGSTGFGYLFIDNTHKLIPHNGGVIIEDFVEIGANCCVDRAKFGNTTVGAGTKIDNLVQIAHNVIIGKCCIITGQAGIAGSTRLGDGVVMAGQSGIIDNLEIADGVTVGVKSVVTHNITNKSQLFGIPAAEKQKAFKIICLSRRLPKLAEQLSSLNRRTTRIESILKLNIKLIRWGTAAAAVILIAFLLSPYKQALFDPHEYAIEQIVRKYQDGNDNFYVSAISHLEDLRVGRNLFIISDITQITEKIFNDHAQMKDSYFLISYKDLSKIKEATAGGKLFFVREIDIEGQKLVLLSTEVKTSTHKPKA